MGAIDPGWLYILAGLVLLGATVLIPAQDDLAEARLQRDRARAIEQRSAQRLTLHSDYLDALASQKQTLVQSLAFTQLNLVPEGKTALWLPGIEESSQFDASVLHRLEPEPTPLPELELENTLLRRWTTHEHHRLWLIACGALCVLFGLLPPSVGR